MNIDGQNTLACTKGLDDVKGDISIYPLPHMPVVKDLVPDLTDLYAQYASIEPWLKTDTPQPQTEWKQSREDREKIDGLYECVFYARAAQPPAPLIGGTPINISALPSCCKPIAGWLTAAMKRPATGSMIWKTRSGLSLSYNYELRQSLPERSVSG